VLQTEFEFTLPLGYADQDGDVHRDGVMRRATAADEILPLRDARVQANPAYLVVVLMSRVILRLGRLDRVTPQVVEGLFATDLAYLQRLYDSINAFDEESRPIRCPQCDSVFQLPTGGTSSTSPFPASVPIQAGS